MIPLARAAGLALVLLVSASARSPQGDDDVPASTVLQVERGTASMIALESPAGEWAYESAIRNSGEIPIGLRAGGTGAVVASLAMVPGARNDAARRTAIDRGLHVLSRMLDDPQMSENIQPGLDMRIFGLVEIGRALLAVHAARVPTTLAEDEVERRINEVVRRLVALEIPRTAGWSYARPSGRLLPAPAYSYVTADVLHILIEANAQGFDVDDDVIERGLDVLVRQREDTGAFAYSGPAGADEATRLPSSAGRTVGCELVLFLADRSDVLHLRGAVDAFFAHWDRLAERRNRTELHAPPFGIAPYYFLYAHARAGRAIELLPERDRPEYRARLAEKLFDVRDEETGLWNDRVYKRSAAYGTAVAIEALMAPRLRPLGRYASPPPEPDEHVDGEDEGGG